MREKVDIAQFTGAGSQTIDVSDSFAVKVFKLKGRGFDAEKIADMLFSSRDGVEDKRKNPFWDRLYKQVVKALSEDAPAMNESKDRLTQQVLKLASRGMTTNQITDRLHNAKDSLTNETIRNEKWKMLQTQVKAILTERDGKGK